MMMLLINHLLKKPPPLTSRLSVQNEETNASKLALVDVDW